MGSSILPKNEHCTEVRFASFLSGGFITDTVVNPPERKLEKCTSVHWGDYMAYPAEKNKLNYFLNSALASELSQIKKK